MPAYPLLCILAFLCLQPSVFFLFLPVCYGYFNCLLADTGPKCATLQSIKKRKSKRSVFDDNDGAGDKSTIKSMVKNMFSKDKDKEKEKGILTVPSAKRSNNLPRTSATPPAAERENLLMPPPAVLISDDSISVSDSEFTLECSLYGTDNASRIRRSRVSSPVYHASPV